MRIREHACKCFMHLNEWQHCNVKVQVRRTLHYNVRQWAWS